jgi:hypothetical protein
MSRRSEQLLAIATDFIRQHDEWAEAANRPNPDAAYWDAVTTLVDSFEDGDIPAESRALADAVENFRDEADAFEERDDESVLYPSAAFWTALTAVRQVVERPARRELPPLESIKELAAMPYMQHAQICHMYGFLDRRGNPMTRLVQMELDLPGSVIGDGAKGKGLIDGRDWVDPRLAELEKSEGAADRATDAIEAKGKRARKEAEKCPESARDLWEQGVSAGQAAKMLRQKDADVAKQFNEWTASRDFGKKVWDLVDKGVPVPEICKQLKTDSKKVEAAIRSRGGEESEAA